MPGPAGFFEEDGGGIEFVDRHVRGRESAFDPDVPDVNLCDFDAASLGEIGFDFPFDRGGIAGCLGVRNRWKRGHCQKRSGDETHVYRVAPHDRISFAKVEEQERT
ncbi:MAG: hypothetical protein EXR07_17480 [Acetobacteraceae bacterium]|nr:hypothetical protein [Acetobacteraceae bacterium]